MTPLDVILYVTILTIFQENHSYTNIRTVYLQIRKKEYKVIWHSYFMFVIYC